MIIELFARQRLLLALVFFTPVAGGCKSEPPSTEPPIVVQDRVYVATKEALTVADDHIDLDADNLEREYVPGDVVVNANPRSPYLRRVSGLSRAGHTVSIETRPATLEDVFLSGHLHADSTTDSGLTTSSLSGPKFNGWTFKFDNTTLAANAGSALDLTDGYFELDGGLALDASFDSGKLARLHLLISGDFRAKIAYLLTEQGSFSVSQKFPIFSPPDIPFYVQAGPIPVLVTMKLEVSAGVNVSVSGASVSAHEVVAASSAIRAGVDCDEHGCTPIGDQAFTFQPDPIELRGAGNGNLTVPIVGKVSLRVYGIAGPFVTLQPYAGLAVSSNASGVRASGLVGVKSTIGGEFAIFSNRVAGFQGQLFDWSATFGNVSFPAAAPLCESQVGNVAAKTTRCDRAAFVDEYERLSDCVANGGGASCLTSTASSERVCDNDSGGYVCDQRALFACLCYGGGLGCFDERCAPCATDALLCPTPP